MLEESRTIALPSTFLGEEVGTLALLFWDLVHGMLTHKRFVPLQPQLAMGGEGGPAPVSVDVQTARALVGMFFVCAGVLFVFFCTSRRNLHPQNKY